MKILTIFTFFILTANYAYADNIVNYLNNNPKIEKDVEAKIYYPHEKKRYPYKGFAYCDLIDGTLHCQGENIFCIIIPWHTGDYKIKYKVEGCNWVKYPEEKRRETEKDLEMQKNYVKVISGSLNNPKIRWILKQEYEEKLKKQKKKLN